MGWKDKSETPVFLKIIGKPVVEKKGKSLTGIINEAVKYEDAKSETGVYMKETPTLIVEKDSKYLAVITSSAYSKGKLEIIGNYFASNNTIIVKECKVFEECFFRKIVGNIQNVNIMAGKDLEVTIFNAVMYENENSDACLPMTSSPKLIVEKGSKCLASVSSASTLRSKLEICGDYYPLKNYIKAKSCKIVCNDY